MPNKDTTEIFIEKAKLKHKNLFDYSLVDYKQSQIKVKIICKKHGVFEQRPNDHLSGYGCKKCATSQPTTKIFIDQAKEIHNNKFNYDKVIYKNNRSKIIIICPTHGEFLQRPSSHLAGNGCHNCSIDNWRGNTNTFLEKANKIYDFEYDYSSVKYKTATTKVSILCKKHGLFEQRPSDHLSGYGCAKCNHSKGEEVIFNYLNENKISSITQLSFPNCKYIKPLRFDFAITKNNEIKGLIEYQGIQHYIQWAIWGGEKALLKSQERDQIKVNYCKVNNIPLLKISYKEINKIENILTSFLLSL